MAIEIKCEGKHIIQLMGVIALGKELKYVVSGLNRGVITIKLLCVFLSNVLLFIMMKLLKGDLGKQPQLVISLFN